MITHACAAAALSYGLRVASYASSWVEVPLLEGTPEPLPFLSIVVPARDEERSIERCVRSLLAQQDLDCEVIVVDDRSSDATPAILERLAGEFPRLRVVRGEPLPEGWVGKPWALHQGAAAARGSWLLFTDADSAHAPRGAASALWFARWIGADALSVATYQELESFWERALLPSILGMVFFACGSLGQINDPADPKHALANGQYLLVSRAALEGLGGHAALKGEIAEDVAFARRIKADGRFRFVLAGGEELARVRMYRSGGEIWRGFTKNVFVGAKGDLVSLFGGAFYMLTISAFPPMLAIRALVRRRYLEAAEAAACSLATVAAASWAIGRTRLSRNLGLYQPIGTAFLAAVTLNSTYRVLSGRGVEWRGRRYSGKSAPESGVRRS
ncbi:MAG: glycosyltransferase family 2 protein [Candidatus Baltobacteraceae bacterium]